MTEIWSVNPLMKLTAKEYACVLMILAYSNWSVWSKSKLHSQVMKAPDSQSAKRTGSRKHWSVSSFVKSIFVLLLIIINPLTVRVVGTPQMILQPVFFSIFPCSPLPSGLCRTPGLSIPWCCLPTSSFVSLVFVLLSLCLARWFWPDLMNGKHDHTTAVCVSLLSSGDLHVVQLPAGSWHGFPRW